MEFCAQVGKPLAAADALAVADDELHHRPGRRRTAEDVPVEADALLAAGPVGGCDLPLERDRLSPSRQ